MNDPKTVGEILHQLRSINDTREFRSCLEKEVVDHYRTGPRSEDEKRIPPVIADPKFISDITGLLYFALHGEQDESK